MKSVESIESIDKQIEELQAKKEKKINTKEDWEWLNENRELL